MEFVWPKNFTFVGKSHPDGVQVSPDLIAGYASKIADLLHESGVKPGDKIALWLSAGTDQVAAMLGCWMAGTAFCVLPSFAGRSNTERSQQRIDDVLSVLNPRLLIQGQNSALPDTVAGSVTTLTLPGIDTATKSGLDPLAKINARPPGDMAFIQFTSGSTGGAKGAVVRFGQLGANLDAIAERTQLSDQDCMVSWAPLYHDMGLMAVLLPLSRAADIVLMETDHFVRRPSAWLDTMSRFKGTVTTAPPTALKLLTRRPAKNVDLSAWRYAWIGGEMVFQSVLAAFEQAYAPAGLAKGVVQPTYGMAETVVGISCGLPGVAWTVRDGVVSCGPALEGMELQVVDDADAPLADGDVGRVMVRGPSVISGYLGLQPFDENAWFETGDLGVIDDGLLYVTGRIKDVLKRGAESFPAALVEVVAEDALGLRTGRAAAFANLRADIGKEEIVLLVESRGWEDQHARTVASAVASELGLQIDVIRNAIGGRLPRTSSGKLMRQKTAALFREGLI